MASVEIADGATGRANRAVVLTAQTDDGTALSDFRAFVAVLPSSLNFHRMKMRMVVAMTNPQLRVEFHRCALMLHCFKFR